MKPDITKFYTDEEIVQAAIEVLRRKAAEITGMIAGISLVREKSREAREKASELFKHEDIVKDCLRKIERTVERNDAIAIEAASTEVGEKLAGEPSQEAERPQPR